MQLCPCGFANADTAATCVACGRTLNAVSSGSDGGANTSLDADSFPTPPDAPPAAEASRASSAPCAPRTLVLENARGGAISIPAPGGLLGRAGDFEPDSFSPRVSGVHALVVCDEEGHWTIEHLGRNGSSVERGGSWTTLRTGEPEPLFGGETLKLADMVFRVSLAAVATSEAGAIATTTGSDATTAAAARNATGAPVAVLLGDVDAPGQSVITPEPPLAWSVRCPVCGTEHAVASSEERVAQCSFCQDPLDARHIARIAPRPLPHA
ncbi:FHA domain-containing protein [uncultured Adlercreutzia sp.]|uniref:FHA domain-containing protein n=1 Tax=uncultured Adlercreutzia sp. TaxID=875803 RepID=UPI0025E12C20|nr:FHA domain-containing protein [uncultured Adlercreutzia sp.]MCI9262298.1 FHA domain-containing protein [Eggerthellaceae bacterium]